MEDEAREGNRKGPDSIVFQTKETNVDSSLRELGSRWRVVQPERKHNHIDDFKEPLGQMRFRIQNEG